jgi:hypothetical protein
MITEQDILDRAPDLLARLSGMQVQPHPQHHAADLVLRLGDRILILQAKSNSHAGPVAAAAEAAARAAAQLDPNAAGVVVVPFMGELGRRICKEAGVGYLDLSGNAHIKALPLLLHVEGRPNRFLSRGRPSSVFASKSSRVARLLLLDPARWWKQSELSQEGNLGAGYVSRICKRLDAEQLIDRNDEHALRPRDSNLLLDAWQSQYRFDRHDIQRGHVAARSGEELLDRVSKVLDTASVHYAATGLAAAWLLAPFAGFRLVTFYMDDAPSEQLLRQLKWHPEERGANLWLVRPNDAGVFHGADDVQGVSCVSAVQAYLDLEAMPERAEEAAAHLREERLRWQ